MHNYTLCTAAYPESCRALTKAALAVLKEYILSEDTLHSFDLLLTEATSNCARHAYRYSDVGDVEIVLEIEPGRSITARISDWGEGFPEGTALPDKPVLSRPEAEGGRGLFIIASLSTQFRVTGADGKNTVHATLDIPRGLWAR